MKKHPTWSAAALAPHMNEPFFQDILPGVLHHHEHINGRGYPDGLEGDNIPLFARLILVVDTFDAITQCRSYRNRQPYEFVLSELNRCSGTQFDTYFAKTFIESSHHWISELRDMEDDDNVISLYRAA